jgi:outer membrane receptor protein involved in Fe transport
VLHIGNGFAPERALRRSMAEIVRHSPPAALRASLLCTVASLTATTSTVAQDVVSLPTIDVAAGEGSRSTSMPTLAASEMRFSGTEVNERIFLRPGEALEVVPGLIVTQHSGEGKANQYFLRGFNLDHGTDLAIWVDGMPINMVTHGHGQGYADLNFLIPELISYVDVKKGPYFAEEGDFSSVGAIRISLVDGFSTQYFKPTVGSFNYQRYLGIGTTKIGEGTLLLAGEVGRYDGPWVNPDDAFKLNGVIRYSQGTPDNGFALTGMAYSNRWNSTDQIPLRAITRGELSRYGAIDPTDGGASSRYSISGHWAQTTADATTQVSAYAIKSSLNLWNNFTYFLNDAFTPPDDPLAGDQFQQQDQRVTTGASALHRFKGDFGGIPSETEFGVQARFDAINLSLQNTYLRQFASLTRSDKVKEGNLGFYGQTTLFWNDWFKTNFGWRGNFFAGSVDAVSNPVNSGTPNAFIGSPKVSLVFGPFAKTEYFLNLGSGFHSNDIRGVTIKENPVDATDRLSPSPFLVATKGAEAGFRTRAIDGLDSSVSVFVLDSASEILFVGDAGTTEASRPSRRIGVEFTNDYRPVPWLDIEADLAVTRARFLGYDWAQAEAYNALDGFPEAQFGNAAGNYIPGAPAMIASVGATFGEALGWYGGVRFRYFGPRPLTEDGAFRAPATGLLNAHIGYRFDNGFSIELDAFNLTNSRSDQITYAYGSFIRSDSLFQACRAGGSDSPNFAAACANGVMDRVLHPVEPLAFRVVLAGRF